MSMVQIIPEENKVIGYVHNGRGLTDNFKNYFVIQFDKKILEYGTWENRTGDNWKGELTREGKGIGAWFRFADGAKVQAKIASSYICSGHRIPSCIFIRFGIFFTFRSLLSAPSSFYSLSIPAGNYCQYPPHCICFPVGSDML